MIQFGNLWSRVSGLAVLSLALVLASASYVAAQDVTGSIRGLVVDQQGSVIPGATITARNQETGTERSATSDDNGAFSMTKLTPGKYSITVEKSGFKKKLVTDISLNLGENSVGTVALEAGAVSETVTVTAGTEEIINRDQAQMSGTFESRKIQDLPSNSAGGGLDTLLLNIPGVAQNSGGGTNTNGTGLSVNGNRGRSNNFQIDGSDNNDLSVGGPSLFIGNQDQVQEVQIITNNFSAQYGRNLGSVVNYVTKGGTNDFHGTAFEYHRDQRNLDTLDNIERAGGQTQPARFLSNVFGGTVGGPIIKNKAFFFGSYEGIRQPQEFLAESGSLSIVQSDLARLVTNNPGNPIIAALGSSSPFALGLGVVAPRASLGGATQTSCLNPASRTSANPLGVVACGSAGAQGPFQLGGAFDVVRINNIYYQAAFPQRTFKTDFRQNEFSVRGDVTLTSKDNFYLRYLDQRGFNLNAGGSTSGYTWDLPANAKNFGGTYVRQISTKTTNEFRGIWQKINFLFGGCSAYGGNASTPGCVTTPSDIENQQVEAISFGAGTAPGLLNPSVALGTINNNVGLPQGRTVDVWQFADNLSHVIGRHSLLAGAEFKYTKASVPFLPRFAGQFTYTSAASLLNNQPTQAIIALGNPIINYTEWDQYYFLQDDWKIRDNLTLNLGVRYEYNGQPINQLRDLQLARESNASTGFWLPALPIEQRVQAEIPADKNNFAPRIGFAWSPRFEHGFLNKLTGTDATVVRGGFAITYDPAFYNILLNVSNSAPQTLLANVTGATAAGLGIPSTSGADIRAKAVATGLLPKGLLNPAFLSQSFVSPNFYSPYSEQWSFGIQRQIGRNHVIEAAYVGNRGIGLFQTVDQNPLVVRLVNGFSNAVCTAVDAAGNCTATQTINYPSFASRLPSGVAPQTATTCPDDPRTPTANESTIAAGRLQCRGQFSVRANTGRSWYDSLQVRYAGRFLKNSLSINGAYTYGKTLDNTSEIFTFGTEANVISANPFDYTAAEKGISNLHRKHLGSLSFIYDLPYYKEQHGFKGHLLGGFQINGNYVYNSARPFTPSQVFSVSFLGVGNTYSTTTGNDAIRPFIGSASAPFDTVGISQVDAFRAGFIDHVTDINGFISFNALNTTGDVTPVTKDQVRFIINGPGAARIFNNPFGDMPRNYGRSIPIDQLNLGIFKTTKIRENISLQFRFEMYNALNHPQAGFGVTRNSQNPDIILEDAGFTFADTKQVEQARRALQFGLRLIF
jgi:outer membrane receptor protein involved in Fe transport